MLQKIHYSLILVKSMKNNFNVYFYFMAVIFPSLKSLAPYLETSVGGEAWKGVLDKMHTNLETALGFQGVRVGDRQERTRHELQSPPLWSVSGREGSEACGATLSFVKSSTWQMGQDTPRLSSALVYMLGNFENWNLTAWGSQLRLITHQSFSQHLRDSIICLKSTP